MITHGFHADIAKEVGVNAATLYERIRHYCEHAKANNRSLHDGKHWCYNSAEAWAEIMPFLSAKQVTYALKKLEDADLIEVGNFNKKGFDRTSWYYAKPLKDNISQNCQMDSPNLSNPSDKIVRPIPEYTHNNTSLIYAREDLTKIRDLCVEAARPALRPENTVWIDILPIWAALNDEKNPVDLDQDVLPVLQSLGLKCAGKNITTFKYFMSAIFQARDNRLAGNPEPNLTTTERNYGKPRRNYFDERQEQINQAALRAIESFKNEPFEDF